MQPYRWYDPVELIEEAQGYVADIEQRHHDEKRRMYEAMSDENYRLRRVTDHLASQLAGLTSRDPLSIIMTTSEASARGLRMDGLR